METNLLAKLSATCEASRFLGLATDWLVRREDGVRRECQQGGTAAAAPPAGPARQGSPGLCVRAPPLGLLILHVGDEPAAGVVGALQKLGEKVHSSISLTLVGPSLPAAPGGSSQITLLLILRRVKC